MVLGNTLQNMRDTYQSFTRGSGQPSSSPLNNMRRSRPRDHEWDDRPSSSDVHDFNAHSASPSRLRAMLSRRDTELQRERQRYRTLESTLQRAQEDHKQLKNNNNRLRALLRDADARFLLVIETHMQSYAQRNGFRFAKISNQSVGPLLDQLLGSVVNNIDLRKQVETLQSHTQNAQKWAQAAKKEEEEKLVAQDQAQALQDQVHTLQRQLLAQVDKECAVSDDRLMRDFRCLLAWIKSLSRSIHITKDTDMLEILGVGGLLVDVDKGHWNSRARKKYLAEAWIWSVVIDRIFASPFALLEETGGSMTNLWYRLFGGGHDHGWPTPSEMCEKWRYTTMEHSVEAFGLAASMSNDAEDTAKMQDDGHDNLFQDRSEGTAFEIRVKTIDLIATRLATISAKGDFAQIPKIVDRAIALAVEMSLQRCRLQVTYPAVNASFVESQMSAIADPDGDDVQYGVVAFIVHPGLTKWGDANGKALDQRYDIVPSLVQLQAHEKVVYVKSEMTEASETDLDAVDGFV